MALARFIEVGKTATAELSPIGSQYDIAFNAFKNFFKLKTNVEWEARLEKTGRCGCSNDTSDSSCDSHFQYRPPAPGKPKGAMKQSSTLADTWAKKGNGSGESLREVAVLMPSVEVEDDEIGYCARTPEGGW
jgi:hypothetical protein